MSDLKKKNGIPAEGSAEPAADITVEDLEIAAVNTQCDRTAAENFVIKNVKLTAKEQIEYHDSVTTI